MLCYLNDKLVHFIYAQILTVQIHVLSLNIITPPMRKIPIRTEAESQLIPGVAETK